MLKLQLRNLKQVMDDNVKFKIRIEKLEKNNRVIIKFEFKNAKLKAKDIKLKNLY